ncbi:MAG: RecX family transcriptional regulator [Patescibacteria group bacterium]
MIVTDIKSQIKNPERVSIYIDGSFWCGLHINQIVDLKIKRGQELAEHEANRLKKQSELGKMHAKALDWLVLRPRSTRELTDYLKRKGYDQDESDYVFSRLEKYLDDEAFARFWVDGRRRSKLKSEREIRAELAKKGVPRSVVDTVIDDHDSSDTRVLTQLIDKKNLRRKYPDEQKLIAYLARKGFSYSTITEALAAED